MGYYINPEGTSKELWLREHGTPISAAEALSHDPTGPSLPVCLVDNGAFTAAGIGYDPTRGRGFRIPGWTEKKWCLVSKARCCSSRRSLGALGRQASGGG